jgi:hypothetical protein
MKTIASPFVQALTQLVIAEIRSQRAEGTVGMSANNLWQIVASRASRLPDAPRGTNAAYFAREAFEEAIDDLPSSYANHIIT